MSQIRLKSISGITSITTPAGVDNQLTLHTNNTTERLKIDEAGNVRVANTFDCVGVSTFRNNLFAQADLRIAGEIVHISDADTRIQFPSNDTIAFKTANSERLRITGTGLVGINVTPASGHLLHIKDSVADAKLKIESESGYDARLILDTSNGSGAGAHIDFQIDGTVKGGIQYVSNASASDTHDIVFRNTSNTERLRIETDGNVKATTGTQYKGFKVCKADGGLVAELVGFASDNDEGGLSLWDGGNKKTQIVSNGYSWFMGGNVGINTTTPTQRLVSYADSGYPFVANGPSNSIALNNAGVIVFGTKDVAAYATGSFDANDYTFKTNAGVRASITSGGQVNIGGDYTQTSRFVNINGGSSVGQLQVKGTEADIWLHSTGPGNTQWRILGSTGNSTHRFRIYDQTNSAERLHITSDGDVNIPTGHLQAQDLKLGLLADRHPIIQRAVASSGSQTLSITGGSGYSDHTGSAQLPTDAKQGSLISLSGGNPTSDTYGGGIKYYANGHTNPNNPGGGNQHLFYTRSGVDTYSERFRITEDGQLLQGETNPLDSNTAIQFRKDVVGNTARFIFRNRGNNGNSRVQIEAMTLNRAANADVFSGIEKYQNGGMAIYNGENTNQYSNINFFTNGWRSLQLRNGNHSGAWCAEIDAYWGTSNGLRMEVGGPQSGTWQAIDFHTSHTGTQRGYIGVTYGGVSYNSSSDYRMKQDVVDMTGAIDRIKLFLPKRFKWKEDPTHTVDGFLAHEAATVVPESVQGEKDGEQMQVMDNSKLVPVLTAALKEAIAKIENLETKVAALESS